MTKVDGGQQSDAPSAPALESLTSRYIPKQHSTYVELLQQTLRDPSNRNIALTGRYGTGKSSVLDEFESKNSKKNKTLRVSISALGPGPGSDADKTTITDRIQKELVKQLLYRAAPRDLPFSRFNRIVPLSRTRAFLEATVLVGVVGAALALLRLLPNVAGTGTGNHWLIRVLSWLAIALVFIIAVAAVRRAVYGRFVISDLSAAGAAVKLTQRTSTYFDEHLEEIVYFFDKVSPDIVIFEDLDRFDDPHIFEALRELNALLNNTAKRKRKNAPLRFIYAIKDSLFERLGTEADKTPADAAAAETVRANRTKFFDIVIPVVPFISHRNARELLANLLKVRGIDDIDRPLIGLVAQHATDMRLLRNICNEYMVFANRLLVPKAAPGLTASNLFALVAYKNFHLKDFENIARCDSDLDVLYDRRRELVRENIETSEKRKRELLIDPTQHRSMARTAQRLGKRLETAGQLARSVFSNYIGWQHLQYGVGTIRYLSNETSSYAFWSAVAEARNISILVTTEPQSQGQPMINLNGDHISELFPEAMDAGQWMSMDESANQRTLSDLDDDIAFLRGADFQHLASKSRFMLHTEDGDKAFSELVDATLKSNLARNLIRHGYIDQNFTLYAAQFYGDFSGVDVAAFIVQGVQTNTMNIDHQFSSPGAITNLLAEAGDDFLRTVSAYNIAILDYLLEENDDRAKHIADTISSNFGDDAQRFLKAYLNSGSHRVRLAALLSQRAWPRVFAYLAQDEGIPANVRPALVDAALQAAKVDAAYELSHEVGDFIVENYLSMPVFTSPQENGVANEVVALVEAAKVDFTELAGMGKTIRDRIVQKHLFSLTADNLREALGGTGDISFDRVRENEDVYSFCLARPSEYVAAINNDSETPHSVLTEPTLVAVLTKISENWEEDRAHEVIAMAAQRTRLKRLDTVPAQFWPDLAAHHLFSATAPNVRDYRTTVGSIDQRLADLLMEAGSIERDTSDNENANAVVAIDVLNASDVISETHQRADLVVSLNLDDYISPTAIAPEPTDLFALLLDHELIEDTFEAFTHFRSGGWTAIEPAIGKSARFAEFMTPDLLNGFVAQFLDSQIIPQHLRDKVLDNLDKYLPNDDFAGLVAAGRYALAQRRTLSPDQMLRVAATGDAPLTFRLLNCGSLPPAPDVIGVLTPLGPPYNYLVNREKTEFEVPGDEEHRMVFDCLKRAHLISDLRKKPRKDVYIVKLAPQPRLSEEVASSSARTRRSQLRPPTH